MGEVGRAREKHLAFRVLSQFPKCIHNLIDAQLKRGPFLLEHCHFKCKLIKYRILLNHSACFDWLNAITRFDRRMGMHQLRFRYTLTPYKKHMKNYQLCFKYTCMIDSLMFHYCKQLCNILEIPLLSKVNEVFKDNPNF